MGNVGAVVVVVEVVAKIKCLSLCEEEFLKWRVSLSVMAPQVRENDDRPHITL